MPHDSRSQRDYSRIPIANTFDALDSSWVGDDELGVQYRIVGQRSDGLNNSRKRASEGAASTSDQLCLVARLTNERAEAIELILEHRPRGRKRRWVQRRMHETVRPDERGDFNAGA
jgi:hypothetical protein